MRRLFALLFAAVAALPAAAQPQKSLQVILLGTGGGPVVNLRRYGPSTLVKAGEQWLLFDCEVFARVKLKLAVFSHTVGQETLVTRTREMYKGPLEIGEDLMMIDIGDTVEVHRPGQ